MALQKRVNVLLANCTAVGVSDIDVTIMSLEGLNIYHALLNAFEEYEKSNSSNMEKNVLNVESMSPRIFYPFLELFCLMYFVLSVA
jgi:hypothetical protein